MDSPDDLSRVIDETSPEYTPLNTNIKHSGTAAYHLAHPDGISNERLTYTNAFHVYADAELSFYSRLRRATSDQVARVEISDDDGSSWNVVYDQAGSGDAGETSFTKQTISLIAYEGDTVSVRFSYDFEGGSYNPGTDDNLGWFIDNVEFTGLSTVETPYSATLAAGETFCFNPTIAQTYWMRARPLHHGTAWPSGPELEITGVEPSEYSGWASAYEAVA